MLDSLSKAYGLLFLEEVRRHLTSPALGCGIASLGLKLLAERRLCDKGLSFSLDGALVISAQLRFVQIKRVFRGLII